MSFSGIHLNKKGVLIVVSVACLLFMYKYSKYQQYHNIDLRKLLEVAIKASENGGYEVITMKDKLIIGSKGKTKEGANDQVTSADLMSHCSMLKSVKHFFPYLTVISEEAKTDCEDDQVIDYHITKTFDNFPEEYVDQDDVTVWIDPLDATQEYTEKLYTYVTTMVCVAIKGEPVIGVIHRPFEKQTLWAWVGHGESTELSHEGKKYDKLHILISRSHSGKVKDMLSRHIENFELTEAGGAGYKALLVANRQADAYVHVTQIKKWDVCAGNAILNAVGGNMTTKFGDSIDYAKFSSKMNRKGIIATHSPKTHSIFIGKLS